MKLASYPSRPRRGARAFAVVVALCALAFPLAIGCSSSMDPKQCDKLRGDAFDLLNKAQHCANDGDCRQSEWPGCAKPLKQGNFDLIKPMKEAFTKGQCKETASDCKEPPPVYCKQGLCVHKEKGTSDSSGNTPVDKIQLE